MDELDTVDTGIRQHLHEVLGKFLNGRLAIGCNLKNLIVFGDESQLTRYVKEKWKKGDLNLYFWDDIVKKGSEVKER